MKKSRLKPVKSGRNIRMSFSRQKEILEMPNLIEVQKDSYDWFINEGLKDVFEDISPITDHSGHMSLEFKNFWLDKPKYSIDKCKERDATYAAPLNVNVLLRYNKTDKDENGAEAGEDALQDVEIPVQKVYMGDLPIMTDTTAQMIQAVTRKNFGEMIWTP